MEEVKITCGAVCPGDILDHPEGLLVVDRHREGDKTQYTVGVCFHQHPGCRNHLATYKTDWWPNTDPITVYRDQEELWPATAAH